MDVCDEIVLHLRARVPLLVFVTGEEERGLGLLDRARAARDPSAKMFVWDAAGGLRGQDGRRLGDLRTVEAVLERITELVARDPERRDLYVLCDVQAYWDKSPAGDLTERALGR